MTYFSEYFGSAPATGAKVYTSVNDPRTDTNDATVGRYWLNTTTDVLWICTSNTTDENIWKSIGYGSQTISLANTFDIFEDSSAVALYQFEGGSGTDLGGSWSMTSNTFSSGTGTNGECAVGSGSYMRNNSGPNNNLVVSVSCWVNVTNTGNNWLWTSGKQANGTCKRGVRMNGMNVDVVTYTSEYTAQTVTPTVTSGVWAHVVVSGTKLYIDKVDTATITVSGTSSDAYGFYIGANGAYDYGYLTNETYGQPMNGSIDQMRVFNRALTAAEVTILFNEAS